MPSTVRLIATTAVSVIQRLCALEQGVESAKELSYHIVCKLLDDCGVRNWKVRKGLEIRGAKTTAKSFWRFPIETRGDHPQM